MSNALFQMMGKMSPDMNGIIRQFNEFRRAFSGNPQQQVQNLLNSGRVSQDQYNKAVQMANELSKMIK